MISDGGIAKGLGGAALLAALLAAVAFLQWGAAAAGGVGVGYLLGAAPFASWAWILSRAMKAGRSRAVAAFLIVVKLALYSGVLWLTVTRKLVHPAGILAGMTAVIAVLVGAGLLASPAPKEAS
jgi:hypothetical protein